MSSRDGESGFNKLINNNMLPTDKQLEYIHYIEEFSPLLFTGNTIQEASEYIDKNKGYIPLEERVNTWAIINGY